MALVKAPVPAGTPCSVFVDSAMVGSAAVSQTTPYWVAAGAPRSVMFPFPVAVVVVMSVTAWVVTAGSDNSLNVAVMVVLPLDA